MEAIRAWVEGFLRRRYGLEWRMLAAPVLIGAILVAGWLLVGPLLTIPRFTTEGAVVRNGVAVIVICGNNGTMMQQSKALYEAREYVPEPRTGGWRPVKKGSCTTWYHRPPGVEQRLARQERASKQ